MRFIVWGFIFCLFFSAVPDQKTNEYLDFKQMVKEEYEDLEFNGTSLNISGIKLGEINTGIAYAYHNKKTNVRVILINYQYLFRKLKSISEGNTKDTTVKRKHIIAGVLAHEWAHHFLGHIFNKPNASFERNADILAGRVLAQINAPITTIFTIKQLFEGNNYGQHLKPDIREFLMEKGYSTEESITNLNSLNNLSKKLVENYNILNKSKLDENWTKLYNIIEKKPYITDISKYTSGSIFDYALHKSRMESDKKFLLIDTLNLSKDLKLMELITNFNTSIKSVSCDFDVINKTLLKNLNDNFLDSGSLKNGDNKLEELKQNYKDDDRFENLIETLYAAHYYSENKNGKSKSYLENLRAIINLKEPKDKVSYDYELKGGISVHLNLINDSTAALTINNGAIKSNTKPSPDNKGFKYKFETKEGVFYVDCNYFLWLETVAAKSINNKIFLNPYKN